MATYYVRSTDGNNADDGLSWANAEADLHTPTWAAGDTIYVSDNHGPGNYATAITIDGNGTLASPTKFICADDAAEPPTAVASTATVATTGNNSITFNDVMYVEGIAFTAGNSTGTASIQFNAVLDGALQHFKNCEFRLGSSGTSSGIIPGTNSVSIRNKVVWQDCNVRFSAAGQGIGPRSVDFVWSGGSLISGTTSPTNLINAFAGGGGVCLIEGVDLSAGAAGMNLVSGNNNAGRIVFRNCKLPASWSGSLGTPTSPAQRLEMYNCDTNDANGDTNYRLWISDYSGSVKHSTAVRNDAGATDGTTRISWLMESSANAEYPLLPLVTPEIVQWNETTGSAITVTVEIVHNSQGSGTNGVLNDDEIWLEVQYLGTSGFPLSSFITDAKASVLATAAAQATSSASWTGDAAGWDTQALSVTFTPQEKGFLHTKVYLAKASATVYVDPLLTVS